MPSSQRKVKSRKLAATAAFVSVGTLAFVLFAVLGGTQANAATITWGNVGTDFATGANWLGGTAPSNNITSDIGAFTNGTVTNNPVFTADRSINGLQFNSGTAAWTFTGSGGTQTLTLGTGGITNYSAKAWYLLSTMLPVMEVAFLNGIEIPTVQVSDASFDTLGIQIRCYHDYGVAKAEHRGGVKVKGEA
jgi:hypothetical protein